MIPPPVEPGEAPINIRRISVKSPAFENSPIGYVEKPAVLAETLWKKAPSQEISSVAFKSRVPAIRRITLVVITTLECRLSFRKERFFKMSRITRKPNPPKMISPQVVRFSRTLDW